ncbi:MAG: hypothetical protein JRG83_11800 [Deltaproteobacteria bacterium]|nr:hypothetical protein [Deltaproteobacteria bacterium]
MRFHESPRVIFSLILAFGLTAATGAQAHDERWDPAGRFYFGLDVGAEYVDLAGIQGTVAGPFGLLDELGETDETFWTESIGAVLGFADGAGLSLPDPIGENARIELRGRYTRGDSDSSADILGSLAGQFSPADPTVVASIACLCIFQARASQETDLRTWNLDLLYRTDVELVDGVVVTPLVGVTYTNFRLQNEFTLLATDLVAPEFVVSKLRDDTTGHYGGLALGADLRARPMGFLEFSLGLRTDLMGVRSTMQSELDEMGIELGSESDGETDFAARVTTSLGVTLTAGPVELGLEGYANWLSYTPYARHPLSGTDDVSHIDEGDMWGAGWRASLTLYFP